MHALLKSLVLSISLGASAQDLNIKYSTQMQHFQISASGDLAITASPTSSKHDFDFLLGPHRVRHKKLKERLNNCTEWIEFEGGHTMQSLLGSIGNLEQHVMPDGNGDSAEGMALRLFDPLTRLWSIYWADSKNGILDIPVKGSFDNGIGYFFANDIFKEKPVLLQFKWDATDPANPVWSQAFSPDNGKTWEWNWYMYFSADTVHASSEKQKNIGVLELRNYIIKTGRRDNFIDYFETHLIAPQEALEGYALGQYRVKDHPDNFCWLRGFENIEARSSFLPAFYMGPVWQQHRAAANSMLANNDNVQLLRPVALQNGLLVPVKTIGSASLVPQSGIVAVDFYTANSKLEKLMQFFATQYAPLLERYGVKDYSCWISELSDNDFPALPVFQDRNLFLTITFYSNELDYKEHLEKVESAMDEQMKAEMQDIVTFKHTLILYPTKKTMAR